MGIKLYGTLPSPPSHTARLMLEAKGIDYKTIWLLPGLHPALLRTRGFRGGTVPAMKLDGRKLQNSRAISRALEEARPEPPLFPADPEKRLEVEEAERWGEEILQDVPRRIVRWLAVHRPEMRAMIAREIGVPLPRFAAWLNAPSARYMANKVDSDEEIGNAIAMVPALIDHVDELIVEGRDRRAAAERRRLPDRHQRAGADDDGGPAPGLGGAAGGGARDADRPRVPERPPGGACCRRSCWRRSGRQDDLQRLAVVVGAVGLGRLVELHVVGDERRSGRACRRRAARAPGRGA